MSEWVKLKNYPNYEVNRDGVIKSIERTVFIGLNKNKKKLPERVLKSFTSGYGYRFVMVYDKNKGKQTPVFIHKAIMDAFVPNPYNKPQVNHIDGNKQNNDLENLEWVTISENTRHAYACGLAKGYRGEKNANSKLSNTDREFIKNSKEQSGVLAVKYGVSTRLIRHVKNKNKCLEEIGE